MLTVVAFFVALGLLIAVHEYGHYRVAVACGVKVLRFSVLYTNGFEEGEHIRRGDILFGLIRRTLF